MQVWGLHPDVSLAAECHRFRNLVVLNISINVCTKKHKRGVCFISHFCKRFSFCCRPFSRKWSVYSHRSNEYRVDRNVPLLCLYIHNLSFTKEQTPEQRKMSQCRYGSVERFHHTLPCSNHVGICMLKTNPAGVLWISWKCSYRM